MTLLSICQDAADEIGIIRPTSVASNADPDAQKIFRLANKVGTALMRKVAWQALRKEKTFTGLASETQTSILPSDFDRMVPETFWDRTNKNLISGPISAVQWQGLKANDYADDSRPKFARRGDNILIIPTLGGGESLAFEYVSNQWCESSGAVAQSAFAADDDVAKLSEELITCGLVYAYLEAEGLPSGAAYGAYEKHLNDELRNEMGSPGIMVAADIFGGGRHFTGAPPVDGSSSVI